MTGQIEQLTRERDELAARLARVPESSESQKRRKESLELLSLRGRVTQLADELRRLKAKGQPSEASSRPESQTNDGDSILFTASLTNRVGTGQTLVAGGWSMDGLRGYLLLTPAVRKNDPASGGQPLEVQSQVIWAPESFWGEIGWADARSDARRSTVAGVLTAEQADALRAALKGTEGGDLSNTSVAKGGDGKVFGIGFSRKDDVGEGSLMSIQVYPRINADGESVELEMRPGPVSTNTSIYPSLKQARADGQSATP